MLSCADAALSLRPVQPPLSGLSPTLLLRRRAQMRPRSRATAGAAPGSIHVTPLFWTIAYPYRAPRSLWQVCGSSQSTSPLKSSEVTRRTLLRGTKNSSSPRTQNFASPQHLLCLSCSTAYRCRKRNSPYRRDECKMHRRSSSTPSRPMKQLQCVQLRAATIGSPVPRSGSAPPTGRRRSPDPGTVARSGCAAVLHLGAVRQLQLLRL